MSLSDLSTLFPPEKELNRHQLAAYRRWCTFALDASVLLDLYSYRQQARGECLTILEKMQDKIWIPYQAAYEYARNRLSVIRRQITLSQNMRYALRKHVDMEEIEGNVQQIIKQKVSHPFLAPPRIQDRLDKLVDAIVEELQAQEEIFSQLLRKDVIWERLNEITRGRIGPPFSPDELEEIYDYGARRYERQQPPGYKDALGKNGKKGVEKYGDLVIWHELIRRGRETGRAVWFVTSDRKEDWWDLRADHNRPRRELVQEMKTKASVQFLMSETADFYEWASLHLKRKATAETIEEARRSSQIEPMLTLAEIIGRMALPGMLRIAEVASLVEAALRESQESVMRALVDTTAFQQQLSEDVKAFLSALFHGPLQPEAGNDDAEDVDKENEDSEGGTDKGRP